jgi:hypothetical protein
MESAIAKWTKVAFDVAQAGFSVHYRGPMAYKDNWQVLFSDYKKIVDYRKGTGHNEDYFRMGSRRRKEVNLPPNFCPQHFKEMERFLHQRPSVNPLHQRDNFGDNDQAFETLEQLVDFYAEKNIDISADDDDDFVPDPTVRHNPESLAPAGMGTSRLPLRPPPRSSTAAQRGKERLESCARKMNPDPRPMNTTVKCRQTSSQSKMVEVTESQGKELVSTMKKLGKMEDRKVTATGEIATKQLQYFKLQDSEIAAT